MYLNIDETSDVFLNSEMLDPEVKIGNFFTIKEADVSTRVLRQNSFESKTRTGDLTYPISILAIESDELKPQEIEPEEELDEHQTTVKNFITKTFDLIGMMYYKDTI